MNYDDLKWLISMTKAAGITPAQLQKLAQEKGIKNNEDLLMLTESLWNGKRAASLIN